MGNRIEWIDISKGIGIILVIVGHTITLGYSYPIYAFHMPLFFFLSGLVYKEKNLSFITYVKSKVRTLLKPWLVIWLISFFVCLLIHQWRQTLSSQKILEELYTANSNNIQNSSLWYLICFFFVTCLFYFVKDINLKSWRYRLLLLIFAFALLWIKEVLHALHAPLGCLPFKIDSALIALVFYLIAVLYKRPIYEFVTKTKTYKVVIPLIVLSASLCIFNGWSNINSLDFGRIRILYYPIAFLAILVVCIISKILSESKFHKIKKVLVFYGENSLLIFGFQSLWIRLYLLFFNNLEGLNMVLYESNPIRHQVGSFVLVTFVLSPIITYLLLNIRKRNINII